MRIRPAQLGDRDAVERLLAERWDGAIVVAHDTVYRPATLPALIAESGGDITGVLDRARTLKPTIPLLGAGGVPIHDELELQLDVGWLP